MQNQLQRRSTFSIDVPEGNAVVEKASSILVKVIESKYFSASLKIHPYLQLSNINKLRKLHHDATSHKDSVVIMRGFVTYQGSPKGSNEYTWKRCCDIRRDRGHFAAIYHQGEVYAIGTISKIASGTVEKFNAVANQWTHGPNLPQKLACVGAAIMDNTLYVVGGLVGNDVASEVYEFIPETDSTHAQWKEVAAMKMKRPRAKHASIGYAGKIWVAGGCSEGANFDSSVEVYDPLLGCWCDAPNMLAKRDYANLLVINDTLYAIGGDIDDKGSIATRTIESFNRDENRWEFITAFKDERKGFSTCAVGTKIFIFGGDDALGNEDRYDCNTWDCYDVATSKWDSDVLGRTHQMPLIDSWGQAVSIPELSLTYSNDEITHAVQSIHTTSH